MVDILTSLDVVNQSFKKGLRGYDTAEVDEFLDQIAETLQYYSQKTKDLERDMTTKDESLAEYNKMKDVLHEALLMAQKSADDRIKSARTEADRIVSEANERAEQICRDASEEAGRLREGVAQIKNIHDMYEKEVRGMLAKYDRLLNQCNAVSPLAGAVNSVLEGMEEKGQAEAGADDEAEDAAQDKIEQQPDAPRHDKHELEAACSMLGVDPKEVIDSSGTGEEDEQEEK